MVQLITPLWGPLATQQASQALSDSNTDFLVVGVCSSETLLTQQLVSMLSGKATAAAAPGSAAADVIQQQLPGLQMHVSPRERIITLDATAMLSPALLSSLLSPNRPQPAVGSTAAAAVRAAARRAGGSSGSSVPVEGVALLLTLQLLVFLCAVCNVVVISSECIDLQLLQLLEAAGIIAASTHSITATPQQQQQQQQQQPDAAGSGSSRTPTPSSRSSSSTKRQQQQLTAAEAATAAAASPAGRRRGHQQQQQGTAAAAAAASAKALQQQQQQQQQQGPAVANQQFHLADLVLLQCCRGQQQMAPVCLQQLQQLVETCLASTAWHRQRPQSPLLPSAAATAGHVSMLAASGAGGEGRLVAAAQHKQQQQQWQEGERATVNAALGISTTQQRHMNHTAFSIWAVPAPAAAAAAAEAAAPRAPPQLQQLVNQLLHHPRTAATGSSSSSSSSSSVLSEGEWLRCAERVWDAVQDSRELLQYYRAVAEGRLVGAGGWSATGGRFRQQVVSTDAW